MNLLTASISKMLTNRGKHFLLPLNMTLHVGFRQSHLNLTIYLLMNLMHNKFSQKRTTLHIHIKSTLKRFGRETKAHVLFVIVKYM